MINKVYRKVKEIISKKVIRGKIGKQVSIGVYSEVKEDCCIGNYTSIGRNTYITRACIGNYCSIGSFVLIGPGEHDMKNYISTSSLFYNEPYKILTKGNCIIGNDVWIGSHSIILRDVKIGDGAVIGANSVVTKDIPPYAVAVGSPAKIIKFRFKKDQIEKLLESKWWEYDFEEAQIILEDLRKEIIV